LLQVALQILRHEPGLSRGIAQALRETIAFKLRLKWKAFQTHSNVDSMFGVSLLSDFIEKSGAALFLCGVDQRFAQGNGQSCLEK